MIKEFVFFLIRKLINIKLLVANIKTFKRGVLGIFSSNTIYNIIKIICMSLKLINNYYLMTFVQKIIHKILNVFKHLCIL